MAGKVITELSAVDKQTIDQFCQTQNAKDYFMKIYQEKNFDSAFRWLIQTMGLYNLLWEKYCEALEKPEQSKKTL